MSFDELKFVVGLGNPGLDYIDTRHNFGFKFLDNFAQNENLSWKNWSDMASITFYQRNDNKILLAKPMTYMNNSGFAVAALLKYYKIKPQQMLVAYDDFSIPVGQFKFRANGSSGGHNGIGSIIKQTSAENFPRIKLGIGPLPKYIKMPDFVLSKFSGEDKEKIDFILNKSKLIIDSIIDFGFDKAISKITSELKNI